MSFSLSAFVAACREAVTAADAATRVGDVLRKALVEPQSIRRELESLSAGQILHQTSELTVLNVVIPPGFRTPPHNHTLWAVVGIYEGQEDNEFFVDLDGRLESCAKHQVKAPDILSMSKDVIHAISNPLSTRTCGLHVYGGHLDNAERLLWDPDTQQAARFTVDRMSMLLRKIGRRGGNALPATL